jgi:pimeloyl-ACP methyl ester carboxylesterase
MNTVRSLDGTSIAFDTVGAGPPLILVDGALCHRTFGPMPKLARELASRFTVLTYDRRGRGDSGDTLPYAVEREVEDLDALIEEAGGSAFVYGISSGAALALDAAARGLSIRKLALYEAPFIVDGSRPPLPDDYLARLTGMIATGRRGDAVKLFMNTVGVPAVFLALMRIMPVWAKLTAVAHTLVYDFRIVGDHQRGRPLPAGAWEGVTMPTLVMDGGKSPAWIRTAMRSLAGVLPRAMYRTLPGQTHMVTAKAHVPALVDFFQTGAFRADARVDFADIVARQ